MASKADSDFVRRQNRHLVLEALRLAGKAPRTDLGRSTGLSLATITAITTQLLNEKFLVEQPSEEAAATRRGRPRIDLALNPSAVLVLAIKISIDQFELVLADYSGTRLARDVRNVATYHLAPEEVGAKVAGFILAFLAQQNLKPQDVRVVGLAVQGVAEIETGRLGWSPAFKAQDIPLAGPVSKITGIACHIANDANMIAEGLMAREHYQYHGTAAVMFLGHGVGMGLVIDGKTFHGGSGAAAEFGHMNYVPHGALCRCGMAGCLEAYASDYGILRQAEGLPDSSAPPSSAVEPAVMRALESAARRGDKNAVAAYQKAGSAIGFGLARMIALLNPDRIVISGPGLRAFDLMEAEINASIAAGVVPALRQRLKIETVPMDHDMIITGTIDKLLHDLDRDVVARAEP